MNNSDVATALQSLSNALQNAATHANTAVPAVGLAFFNVSAEIQNILRLVQVASFNETLSGTTTVCKAINAMRLLENKPPLSFAFEVHDDALESREEIEEFLKPYVDNLHYWIMDGNEFNPLTMSSGLSYDPETHVITYRRAASNGALEEVCTVSLEDVYNPISFQVASRFEASGPFSVSVGASYLATRIIHPIIQRNEITLRPDIPFSQVEELVLTEALYERYEYYGSALKVPYGPNDEDILFISFDTRFGYRSSFAQVKLGMRTNGNLDLLHRFKRTWRNNTNGKVTWDDLSLWMKTKIMEQLPGVVDNYLTEHPLTDKMIAARRCREADL